LKPCMAAMSPNSDSHSMMMVSWREALRGL
jgi:hypothetical protein